MYRHRPPRLPSRRMRRLLTGLLGATLLLGACGNDDDPGDRAAITSIPDDTTTSSTTTTRPAVPPVDVIPSDPALITEEYVENVLNALYEVSLEAVELARVEGVVEEPSLRLLEATTAEGSTTQRINDLLALAAGGFAGLRDDPEPLTFVVIALSEASPTCIVAEVRTDTSGLVEEVSDADGLREFVRIYPATEAQVATSLNPTAWVLDQFPVTFDGTDPGLRCEP
jgi:hypothetical protein